MVSRKVAMHCREFCFCKYGNPNLSALIQLQTAQLFRPCRTHQCSEAYVARLLIYLRERSSCPCLCFSLFRGTIFTQIDSSRKCGNCYNCLVY